MHDPADVALTERQGRILMRGRRELHADVADMLEGAEAEALLG